MSAPPPKTQAFDVSAPQGTSADRAISAVAATVGISSVCSLQHPGKSDFQVVLKSPSAMGEIVSVGAIQLGDSSVPIVPAGSIILLVAVLSNVRV